MSEIDVSECAFYYDNGKCNNPNGMACNCANVAYCYFKQLQQLKQENSQLGSEYNSIIEVLDGYRKENEELKRENEELYKKIEELDKSYDFIYRQVNYQAELKDKAKAKLEKIKEIAKDIIKNDCYENSDVKAENILQIIESEKE